MILNSRIFNIIFKYVKKFLFWQKACPYRGILEPFLHSYLSCSMPSQEIRKNEFSALRGRGPGSNFYDAIEKSTTV